jgi:teichuronic acid exporter
MNVINLLEIKATSYLGNRVIRGIGWSSLSFGVSRGVSLFSRLLLARLLAPEIFGQMAMIMVFLGLVNIFLDLGLKQSLIQRERDFSSPARYNSAFWFLIFSGFIWASLFAAIGAPLIAVVFGEPGVDVLARAMAVGILFNAASIIPEVRLVRALRFKNLTIVEVISSAISFGIAVVLALQGAGVWALVAQYVANFAAKSILYWRQTRWRPRWHFNFSLLRDVWRFSGFMLGSQILHYIRLNSDNFAIGAFVGSSALGAYSLAYLITETIRSQIGAVVARVMFPVFSQSSGNLEALRRMHLTVVRYMCLVIFPLATILGLEAEGIVQTLFGPQWSEASQPTTILCIAAAVMALNGDPSSLLKGLGKGGTIFSLHAINTLLIGLPAIGFGAFYYGIVGAAYGVLFQAIIHFAMMFTAINRTVGTSTIALLSAASGGALMSIVVAALCAMF